MTTCRRVDVSTERLYPDSKQTGIRRGTVQKARGRPMSRTEWSPGAGSEASTLSSVAPTAQTSARVPSEVTSARGAAGAFWWCGSVFFVISSASGKAVFKVLQFALSTFSSVLSRKESKLNKVTALRKCTS